MGYVNTYFLESGDCIGQGDEREQIRVGNLLMGAVRSCLQGGGSFRMLSRDSTGMGVAGEELI